MKDRIRLIDTTCSVIGVLGLTAGIIECDLFFVGDDGQHYTQTQLTWTLRLFMTVSSVILVLGNYFYYLKSYNYRRLKGITSEIGETFRSSREFKIMLLTNLINIVHAPPGFEYQFILKRIGYEVRYSLSTILSNLMLFRIYLLARIIPNLSKWTDRHAEECCEREGIKADSVFALKCLLKEKPYLMLFINFFISIIVFGISVRTFERSFYED